MKAKVFQKQNKGHLPPGPSGKGSAKINDNRAASLAQLRMAETIQNQEEEEKELVQGKFVAQMVPEEEEGLVQEKAIAQRLENKTGMPDNLKAGVEQLSGMDMGDVKVHYNSDKPASVQAHAFTQGTDIHIGPGQNKHLAHEAWHVAQQKQGRVQATTEVNGMPVNDSPNLENEADVMGEKASGL